MVVHLGQIILQTIPFAPKSIFMSVLVTAEQI